ncbi:trp operon leader peptide [Streptomyces sp. WG5]
MTRWGSGTRHSWCTVRAMFAHSTQNWWWTAPSAAH